jgi:SAM-dependent methyltransferase
METYTEDFFQTIRHGSINSAKEIVPIIFDFINPKSVIDVGCATGTWLSVFSQHGVEDIQGIDGDYVERSKLEIPGEKFSSFDLKKSLNLGRKFDLVISLEVAEHLPKDCAETFVDSLINLGEVILFSAAIPFQGGTEHVNEQWLEYWEKYFKEKGYVAIDCIRKRIWQNDNVEYWYAQNILIFADKDCLELPKYNLLKQELELNKANQLSVVHPKKYLEIAEKYQSEIAVTKWYADEVIKYTDEVKKYAANAEPKNMSLRKVLSALPIIIINTLKKKLSLAKSDVEVT